ncbi:hypothetical protein G7Y89_g10078 [Cudoniella acicularis]|uniref:Uncharacterized protein n=1 Tax=Cudoniella acicularis TaxID=354080 RepID=A0A8H4RG72_9HELO|nr:hypothetical protein G7Y89_g10078 [Cudoniella acicularis]
MPSQETQQPQAQQMELPTQDTSRTAEQPRPVEQMTAEPVSMRGGDGGDICCGISLDTAVPVSHASNASNAAAKRSSHQSMRHDDVKGFHRWMDCMNIYPHDMIH